MVPSREPSLPTPAQKARTVMTDSSHLTPDLLSALLDDEVTAAERAVATAHLAACAACRAELESLRWTVGLLAQLPPVPLPRTFYLSEADIAPPTRARRLPGWLQPVLTFGTALSALAFTLLLVGSFALGGAARDQAAPAAQAPAQPAESLAAEMPAEGEAQKQAETMAEQEPAPAVSPTEPVEGAAASPIAEPTLAPSAEAPAPESGVATDRASPSPPVPGGAAATATGAPTATAPPTATARPTAVSSPSPTAPVVAAAATTAPRSGAVATAPAPPARDLRPALLALFGALTLLFGGASLWLRRR